MPNLPAWTKRIFVALLLGSLIPTATASTIAIIGTGNVAKSLGPEFAAQGHTIVYGSRSPDRDDVQTLVKQSGPDASAVLPSAAAATGEIVVLAVPGMAVADVVRSLGPLDGKVVIDPTNPLTRDQAGRFSLGISGTSNAEIIQDLVPKAHVVKAFNTLSWREMMDPAASGGPISVPIAGNNAQANAAVADLIAAMDLEPIDVGPLDNAHYLEGLLILWINNRYSDRDAFEIHFRKVSTD